MTRHKHQCDECGSKLVVEMYGGGTRWHCPECDVRNNGYIKVASWTNGPPPITDCHWCGTHENPGNICYNCESNRCGECNEPINPMLGECLNCEDECEHMWEGGRHVKVCIECGLLDDSAADERYCEGCKTTAAEVWHEHDTIPGQWLCQCCHSLSTAHIGVCACGENHNEEEV